MIQFIVISLSVLPILCNLRFKDKEQLEQHHNHINPSNDLLIVHMIPHSHDDVGWLKTVEQYFNGLRNDIQKANVEYVIDSYIEELQKDPTRKFIQVETKFFKMWWDRQNEDTRQITKQLVASGQLEFISGGWCMNDEATPYYEDIIDQMTLGHKFLLDTFNVVPTIGWQIDPFGHQNTQAALSYQMGFNAWFFSRIDFEDKDQRLESKNMEMVMVPPAEGVSYPIFTHVQYYHYESPPGFNFDTYRSYDAIVDDLTSLSYNVATKSTTLVNYFKSQALHYKSNHLIHTFGSDFLWTDSKIFYKNLDKLIKYVNEHPEYNMQLRYSTPSEYIKAINEQNIQFSLKQDDFFPYSDKPHAFWTGYFTSRVAIKGYVKRLGRQAQVYKKFLALMTYHNQIDYDIATKSVESLDDALAICQHHDAVSGTEQQHVNDDYLRMLSVGENIVKKTIHNLLSNLLYNQTVEFEQCEYNQTASSCTHTYNALKLNRTITITLIDGKVKQTGQIDVIRLKVPNLKYLIKDSNNNTVLGDVDCTNGFNDCDLYFKYTIVENNVITYFRITPVTSNESASEIKMTVNPFPYTDDTFISLNSTKQFKLKYAYYNAYQGGDQPEGAYIFRTLDNDKITYGKIIYSAIGYGRIMSVFRVSRTYTKTIVKHFYHLNDTYDIQTYLDYIPVNDQQGKDIIMVIEIANFTNNQTFYTDSNGLQFQERILNYRPQYNWSMHELVAGNYYPVNGAIYIQDQDDCVALLNDRSQGGASLQDGQIEIMIHRRLLRDDYRGVDEPLNESEPEGDGLSQIIQHQLTFFNQNQEPNRIRKLQYFGDLKPLIFLSTEANAPQIPENLNWFNPFQGFNIDPLLFYGENLLKFTYFNWNDGQYILRVQNMQERFSMKIDKLAFEGQAIRTTLTGNQLWDDWKKNQLKWNYTQPDTMSEDLDNVLYPLQIQTYIISENIIKQ